MINQVIKSKAKAKSVANQLKDDLLQAVDCFGGYVAEVVEDGTVYQVEFYSDNFCNIITDSVFGYVWKVVKMYMMQYENISYWLSTKDLNGEVRCAVLVNVGYKK